MFVDGFYVFQAVTRNFHAIYLIRPVLTSACAFRLKLKLSIKSVFDIQFRILIGNNASIN